MYCHCHHPPPYASIGGALALLGYEAARGKPLDRDTEALVNYAGYAALILAAVFLFTRDLEHLASSF